MRSGTVAHMWDYVVFREKSEHRQLITFVLSPRSSAASPAYRSDLLIASKPPLIERDRSGKHVPSPRKAPSDTHQLDQPSTLMTERQVILVRHKMMNVLGKFCVLELLTISPDMMLTRTPCLALVLSVTLVHRLGLPETFLYALLILIVQGLMHEEM